MALVQVPIGVSACQVDDFPKDCKRSRKGALYIRPRSTLVLTPDELDHLKAKHGSVASKLIVVGVDEGSARSLAKDAKAEKVVAKVEPKVEPKTEEATEADDGKKKKKRF
jgi:hypothetical protein